MNIKKIIAIIASTALTVTLLASCGSSSSGKTAKKVTKDGKELSVLRVANMTGQPDQYADYIGMEYLRNMVYLSKHQNTLPALTQLTLLQQAQQIQDCLQILLL